MEVVNGGGEGDMERLPEGCISHVISLTSPRDTCRSAVVSATFRSAVSSDAVWERFLPSDYPEILSRAVDPVEFGSKRDLYFRLCSPILLDGGKMSFSLDKSSGGKCYMLSARELSIVWGDTPHYWRWISLPESRFSEVAELLNVCWLEIHGKIDCKLLSPRRTYAAYLIFKLGREDHTSHGLWHPPQEASVKVGAHESKHNVCVQPNGEGLRRPNRFRHFFYWRGMVPLPPQEVEEPAEEWRPPKERQDGWMEIEMGEFFNENGDDGEVDMCFMEVKGGHWKSGLIVQGIEVRPKN